MNDTREKRERVILAGVHTGHGNPLSDTTDGSVKELEELVNTAGGEVVGIMIQNKPDIENATYMGEGKLEELSLSVSALDADTVVFDDELSPIQLKNITDMLKIKVLDRSMLILDIFAMRAKSGEGKLQVELAQLKYRLPRLRGFGAEMSRTGAGIGTRGPGETRLESDRRHIHRRISALEADIKEIKKHRSLIRGRRKKDGVITAALVGYTNAGKSTLLNALTDAGVLAENKLFATLDPTSRGIVLDDNRQILLIDTVGFIRKLPHHLIEAFKSTLEEAAEADLLLHVMDARSHELPEQMCVVDKVLEEIGALGKPVIGVFNKCDGIEEYPPPVSDYDENVYISAKYRKGFDKLTEAISNAAPGKKRRVSLKIPYSCGGILNMLHNSQKVISESYDADGTFVDAMVDKEAYAAIREYLIED